jgi:chromosome segregation ATPase
MQNESPQYPPATPKRPIGWESSSDERSFDEMMEVLREARSDAERASGEAERARRGAEDLRAELQALERRGRRASWSTALLFLALIGACVYGYVAYMGPGSVLEQFPNMQKSLDALAQQVRASDETFRSWASNWETLTARVGNIEQGLRANLQVAKDYATEQAAKVHREVQAEMDNRTRSMEMSINRLQSAQQEDQTELARLRDDMASVRREATQQMASAQRNTDQEMDNLRSQIDRNRGDLDTRARELDRRRMNFEVSKEQTLEIAPGIRLTLSDVNVSYQRIEGRIHVIPDGRILWIRSQGIQQPVRFYAQKDERPYELVFTRVGKDSAVGYVLTPLWPNDGIPVAQNAAAAGADLAN